MADSKLSDLSAAASLASTDLFYVVKTAGSGGVKATLSQLNTLYAGLGANTFTSLQTITVGAANTGVLASTGYSLTGSDTTSMVNLAGTWNTSGTPTAIKLNVTDTASNASSLLMDLQVGGTSRFKVDKGGAITVPGGSSASPAISIGSGVGLYNNAGNILEFYLGGTLAIRMSANGFFYATSAGHVELSTSGFLNWVNGTAGSASTDLALYRDAAGILAQRNGVNAQTLRVYNTYTDASNNEYLSLDWSSNIATIEPKANGTGTARTLRIRGGGYNVIEVSPSGDAILCSGGGQVSFGGSTSSYPAFRRSGTLLQVRLGDNSADGPVSCSYVKTGSTTVAGLPSASTAGSGARAFVTDANATTFLSTVAGGGANKVPVVSDGTNWLIG